MKYEKAISKLEKFTELSKEKSGRGNDQTDR